MNSFQKMADQYDQFTFANDGNDYLLFNKDKYYIHQVDEKYVIQSNILSKLYTVAFDSLEDAMIHALQMIEN